MEEVSIVGVDLAKQVFQVHGRDCRWPDFGRVLLRWRRVARRIIGAESLQAWGMTFGSFPSR